MVHNIENTKNIVGLYPNQGANVPDTTTSVTQKMPPILRYTGSQDNKMKQWCDSKLGNLQYVKEIYTDKKQYEAAKKSAMDSFTYDPDAPSIAYIDKAVLEKYIAIINNAGYDTKQNPIIGQDGSVNVEAFKFSLYEVLQNEYNATHEVQRLYTGKSIISQNKKIFKDLGLDMSLSRETGKLRKAIR